MTRFKTLGRLGALCCVAAIVPLNMGGCIGDLFSPCRNATIDDGDPCTTDACAVENNEAVVTHTPVDNCCETAADCNDSDACTTDTCGNVNADTGAGTCANAAVEGCCNDNSDCDAGEVCENNACVPEVEGCTSDDDCVDDGDLCTTETCDTTTGECSSTDVVCDEGEVCVEGVCTLVCETDDDCTAVDACSEATCVDGTCSTTSACDDGLDCTDDACDDATATCSNTNNCPDGQNCGADGLCEECTVCESDDDCDDDGLFCTGTESCEDGCCASSGDPCDEGETCNEDLNSCVAPPGETIDFTLGTDTSPATDGTGGDDTYTAALIFNAPTGTSAPSLQTGDNANGGDGTDVLTATFNFSTAATTVAPTLTSIETINITDFGSGFATTLSGVAITGATSFNLSNSTNTNVFTISNLPTLANLGVTNQAIGATVSFATAATSGAADAATVSVNGLTGAGTTLTLTTGTTNGVETLNIASSGVASSFSDIAMNGTTLTTVNVSGNANLTITTSLDSNVTTVNASTATGAVNLTQTNAGIFTFTGGAGDDTMILGATYGTTDTINGGAGTGDTLGGTTAVIAGTTANQTNVTNIEKLRVSDELVGTVNLTHFGTISEVVLDDGANVGIITNAATGFKVTSGLSGGAVCVGTSTLAVTVAGSLTTDTATYTLNDCEQAGAVTFTGVETLNLVSNLDLDGSAANSGTAGQNTLTSTLIMTDTAAVEKVVITGTEQLNLTGAVTANQLDASGFSQPLIMGALMATSGVTVTGGAGADTLFGSAGNDIIDGGAAADIITAGDGQDLITGGAAADTFQFTEGDLSAAPSDTVFDTITDFARNSDIFDETVTALVIMPSATAAVAGTALINAEGIASFAAADDTLAERVIATEAGINLGGAAANAQFAVFEHGTNSYLFISDGTDGIGALDMLFQLTGVTGLSDTTITGGNLTIN